MPIAVKVLRELAKTCEVHLVISRNSLSMINAECGLSWPSGDALVGAIRQDTGSENVFLWDNANMAAPISSGSFKTDGMLIVPCSMKTLAGVAAGYAENLVQRAADVTIKEGRRLILSPREMPLSAIHLENMLKLARLGAAIAPPVMAFYHRPESLEEMTGFAAGRILDLAGVEHGLFRRWDGDYRS